MTDTPRTATFLRTLRRCHAWIGVTGATFGLLFGITGFLQNHRSVMKIQAGHAEESKVTVDLGEAPPTLEALAQTLGGKMGWEPGRVRTRLQPGRPARIGGAEVQAAPKWIVMYPGHAHGARAVTSPGNRTVEVELERGNFAEILMNLHKAEAGQRGWILLTDAFAGALVFMTLSGLLLWTRLAGPRLLTLGLALGGLATAIAIASRAW